MAAAGGCCKGEEGAAFRLGSKQNFKGKMGFETKQEKFKKKKKK